ncbi:MAG: oxygen-dependent coproporphyrinogen oxidase [Bacteroidota bacterium]|nr:oxygen-dependent coproporphyrinogen oxidase [Bacteroidota bacterium]
MPSFKDRWIRFIQDLQERICEVLASEDGKETFRTDRWEREEGSGGGGITRVISGGAVIEKGGVNTSVVHGAVTEPMRQQLKIEGSHWFACGLSLVIHPLNPHVPTSHANWRYFELYDESGGVSDRWFGGGSDLTPYYLVEEDVRHFHRSLKAAMDPFGPARYPEYKKWCDSYFVNSHRNREMRGVGGVFYDYLRPRDDREWEELFRFQQAGADGWIRGYLPIISRRKNQEYGPRQVFWQELRRGRYVEFNLIHDRGTLFGLKTQGRTESILMSLPPRARWEYDHHPEPGSEEEVLLDACTHPRDWIN